MATTQATRQVVSVQLPTETVEQLRSMAIEADRSLSAELRRAVTAHVERETFVRSKPA